MMLGKLFPIKTEVLISDLAYLEESLEVLDKIKEKHPNMIITIRVGKF